MGRPYRLVGMAGIGVTKGLGSVEGRRVWSRWHVEAGGLMNQYPAAGSYQVKVGFVDAAVAGEKIVSLGEGYGEGEDVIFRAGRAVFDERGAATVDLLGGNDRGDDGGDDDGMAALVSRRDQLMCVLEFVRPV